ncbi:malto-oligosyltrehalose synthase [Modestobacter sp. I12A-02628]|uniref:Malto-oligosyltrehalose synthase n=1 Tax=Goekera deserti TaxID=2497753 RepID=A0A7K3WDA1_9ACTN|nr:malto-oligosyltrehalose synthase [Goekera deserti]MPQ96802.1 malto-oligosyltrehalose synthase [Goekera deserti]NDI46884.1 malto-oligosyltrehalose synthase [Goekera deserti]NEL54452.1 malto-oligosyltrehalose synthase [Goekera deserti]
MTPAPPPTSAPAARDRRDVPSATYRLQVHADFTLDDAAAVAGYLADLGVSHAYSSPLLRSSEGSNHGYDTTDHAHVDEARGGRAGLDRFVSALHEVGLGLVLDLVPNHMGVADAHASAWWWDLLQHGRDSAHADAFDVDWEFGDGRVRIPVLGSADDLAQLEVVDGELRYYDNRFPITPGTAEGTPREVHDRQHYELVDWRRADSDLNYRRFFAINTLAGLRAEDPAVFEATHALPMELVRTGAVDGLRIDHPDGLADPGGYLDRLAAASGGRWTVVEKILEPGEALPESWATAGTTGYDAMAEVDGVLVDPAGEPALTALDTEITGAPVDYAQLVHDCKREVTDGILGSEVARLHRLVGELPGVPAEQVREALAELLASFPVYRSYLPAGREHLDATVAAVRERRPDLTEAVNGLHPLLSTAGSELATRFEQTSGPVMAKGVEDSAYYRWARFVALNEVGGDPAHLGRTVEEFHAAQQHRAASLPASMTALSTHDTKRSEDTRARLAVLAELPTEWAGLVRQLLERHPLADRPLAHQVWQNLVGAWPISRERAHAYAEKAAREAGTSTTWTASDAAFEEQLHALVDAAFDDEVTRGAVEELVARITPEGRSNSLSQKLLQLTIAGVPDVYQGSELWDHSLVDPDNRRPVDYDLRRALLARLDGGEVPGVDDTGAAKLLVVSRALRLRRDAPELFTGYTPVAASGPAADHVVAFDRGGAMTVATRLPVGLAAAGGWRDTAVALPTGSWHDVLTGARVVSDAHGAPVAELLARLPVALLTRA